MTDRLASLAARLCLSTELITRRGASVHRQRQVVQSLWPKALCQPIGSFPTRTSLKNSDVDLLVSIPGMDDRRDCVVEAATRMKEAVLGQGITDPWNCIVIAGARVPILTYTDENEVPPLKFDISFQRENAVKNTAYLTEKFDERPFMRDLVVLLKYWLREKQLNEVYKGGMGSYCVSLMVIGFFNFKRRTLARQEYESFITGSRYDMFVEYLQFWTSWRYREDTMIPDPGMVLRKGQGGRKSLPFMLRIFVPFDPGNDVGKGSHKIPRVVTAMIKLKQGMQRLGPDMEVSELDQLLGGTPAERERLLNQKAQQDRSNRKMQLQMQRRLRKAERKAEKKTERKGKLGPAATKSLEKLRAKYDQFIIRRPTLATEVARDVLRLQENADSEQSIPNPEHDFDHDTLMVGRDEREMGSTENADKSPEQLEREAKHAATIEKKRLKREKMLKEREARKKEKREKKAQKKMEAERKRLEEEGSKKARENEASN
ncbi:hypothetical protein C7212DRAFT_293384 [Tuber magnatum]|uniref:Poly(A) RNA polymerase mitochondrial-like central palm domain-containing protein n=1 Tax=Tuber magnatum TaxID=42249 RepID=A0A317SVJ2_9PEZI|nr:hypothetical protein C7212DRAFT_293384 [Tuber magnatum]